MSESPRVRRAAVAALALFIVSAPAASAQDPDTPPPGTLVLGPVRVTPTLTLDDMGVDNNVKNEPENPKSDFTFTLTPRANVTFRLRRLRVSYDLLTQYVYFQKYASERGTNTGSTIRADFDLGRLRPYASVQGLNSQTRLNSEVDARARHHDLTYSAGTSLLIASRTRLLASGSTTSVAFDAGEEFRGEDLRTSFDGHRDTIDAGVGFELTPLTSLNVLTAREQQRFELSPDRNSDSWRVGPTLAFSPDGLLTGSASVAYRHFDAVSPLVPDYSGLVSEVRVAALIYSRNQVQAVANRDVQYSYEQAAQYYVGTTLGLTWTMVVVGPVDVRGTATRNVMDYRAGTSGDDGRDTLIGYGGGVGYRLTPRARVGINADWSHRDSNRSADRTYENHRIFVGLTWGIKP